jgi:hypothetical protein
LPSSPGQRSLSSGETARLAFDAKDLHLFDEIGLRLAGT